VRVAGDTDGAGPGRGALVIAARRVAGEALVLQLIGSLDLASCPQVREAVDTWRAEPVELDLERVEFIDAWACSC
jgi:anti-anti-sigma regulatory factor